MSNSIRNDHTSSSSDPSKMTTKPYKIKRTRTTKTSWGSCDPAHRRSRSRQIGGETTPLSPPSSRSRAPSSWKCGRPGRSAAWIPRRGRAARSALPRRLRAGSRTRPGPHPPPAPWRWSPAPERPAVPHERLRWEVPPERLRWEAPPPRRRWQTLLRAWVWQLRWWLRWSGGVGLGPSVPRPRLTTDPLSVECEP